MSTTHVRGVRVATEPTFGNLTSGISTTAGLSFAALELELGSVSAPGEPPMNERAEARSDWHELPPEPDTVWSGGVRVRRRTGDITLLCPLRTIGSAVAYGSYAAMPLHMLLNSGMQSYAPDASSDAVAGAVSTVRYTPTVVGNVDVGIGLAVDVGGIREYSFVTDNPADIFHSPAFSVGLSNQTVRLCQTLYTKAGMTLGSSCALELTGDGWRSYAYGCRMKSFSVQFQGRKVLLEIVMQSSYITDSHSAGVLVTEPTRANGAVAHSLGSYVVLSSTAIGTTTPAGLARTAINVDEWSFTYTNVLASLGYSQSILGHSGLEVAASSGEMTLFLSSVDTTPDDDLFTQTQRSVLVGMGPIGTGNGAALYLPAATLKNDPSARDLGKDTVRQKLVYGFGRWSLDDTDGAPTAYPATAPGESMFRLALPL